MGRRLGDRVPVGLAFTAVLSGVLAVGFDLDAIRPFVECLRAGNDSGDVCPDSVAVLRRKLAEVDECVDRLTAVRSRLRAQLESAIETRTRGES
jgi:hypothetical protein